MKNTETTADFGFTQIPRDEKTSRVREVFNRVASRYDLMNDAMSLGRHRAWKRLFMNRLAPRTGERLVDVAGGTGDIARLFLDYGGLDPTRQVTLCDINHCMLEEGRNRSIDQNHLRGIDWICGNAETLPVASAYFDAYTIAFGIRNVTDIPAALKEAYRVLKPGGRFACLEFSHVTMPILDKLYDAYSFHIIPQIGEWIAHDKPAYQYLVESIRKFPPQADFAAMIKEAGFAEVSYENLDGGIVAIHTGWRI